MLVPRPLLALLCAVAMAGAQARAPVDTQVPMPEDAATAGVPGVTPAQLAPAFWIARLAEPDGPLLDRAAIAATNARLLHLDDSLHDLAALPTRLSRARVASWIERLASPPTAPLYGIDGRPIPAATLAAAAANRALDAIPPEQPTRFGMVLARADLRSFPTDVRVFSTLGDTDIDRFQETALFPGTPVVIAHASADGQWLFVVAPRYAAWVRAPLVAEGDRDTVLAYARRAPYRVVTGAQVRTVTTPEQPQLSALPLDMGVRVPLAAVPAGGGVNGQNAYAAWPLDLPVRDARGRLAFAPALLPRTADTAGAELPLTRANIIAQAFKFLGERYGWGHAYNGRDCSGFVSEVYRSMGLLLPRNTGDQAANPALPRVHLPADATRIQRMALVATLQVGDLVYIPGHVMLVIGRIGDEPYVIHDIQGGQVHGTDGQLRALHLNGVSVTPLSPLLADAGEDFIDRITDVVRVAGGPARAAAATASR